MASKLNAYARPGPSDAARASESVRATYDDVYADGYEAMLAGMHVVNRRILETLLPQAG